MDRSTGDTKIVFCADDNGRQFGGVWSCVSRGFCTRYAEDRRWWREDGWSGGGQLTILYSDFGRTYVYAPDGDRNVSV